MSALDRELAAARRRAEMLADQRVRVMTRRLRADGVADRAVLGIPEPFQPTTGAEAYGSFLGAFANAVEEFARQVSRGFSAVRRS